MNDRILVLAIVCLTVLMVLLFLARSAESETTVDCPIDPEDGPIWTAGLYDMVWCWPTLEDDPLYYPEHSEDFGASWIEHDPTPENHFTLSDLPSGTF